MIDHLFLHYSIALDLWHRLFSLAGIDRATPFTMAQMMTISFNSFIVIPKARLYEVTGKPQFDSDNMARKKCEDFLGCLGRQMQFGTCFIFYLPSDVSQAFIYYYYYYYYLDRLNKKCKEKKRGAKRASQSIHRHSLG